MHKPLCGSRTKPCIHLHSPLRDRNTVAFRRTTHCSLLRHWSTKPSVQYLVFTRLTICSTWPLSPALVKLLDVLCCRTVKHTAVTHAVYQYIIYSFVSVITRSTITSEKLKWFNTSNINNQNIKQLRKTGSKSMNIYNRNNHDRQPTTNISQTMCKLIILQNFKATQWNKKFLTPHSNHKFINFAKLGRLHSRS